MILLVTALTKETYFSCFVFNLILYNSFAHMNVFAFMCAFFIYAINMLSINSVGCRNIYFFNNSVSAMDNQNFKLSNPIPLGSGIIFITVIVYHMTKPSHSG